MNRLIKFRAFHPETQKYVVHDWGIGDGDDGYICRDENGESIYSGDLIWEQFTGLLDATSKEIFEGDIVKIGEEWSSHIPMEKDAIELWLNPTDAKSGWYWRGLMGQILFDSGCFMTYPTNNRKIRFFPSYHRQYKITGNVHENNA